MAGADSDSSGAARKLLEDWWRARNETGMVPRMFDDLVERIARALADARETTHLLNSSANNARLLRQTTTFVCRVCEQDKSEDEFYRSGNSRRHVCKSCFRTRVLTKRKQNEDSPSTKTEDIPEPEPVPVTEPEPEHESEPGNAPPMTAIMTGGRRLTNVKEACRYAGFSHSKLYHLIKEKRVKAYKFDNRTLVDLDSIDAMFAALPEW